MLPTASYRVLCGSENDFSLQSLMEILGHIQLNYDDQQEVYSMAEGTERLL